MKVGPSEGKKIRKKVGQCRKKIERGGPRVSSAFANARKSFWLKQGLDPVIGDIKKLSKKKRKMIILNSLIVTKNVERGLWAFSTSLQLQNTKKIERGTLWRQKNSKKSLIASKKN